MSAPGLVRSPQDPADLLLRDVCVLDPRLDLDARHDVLVRDGEVAALGAPGTLTPSADIDIEVVEGRGRLRLLPAFFDPHVHLRSPGQEHKEDIESGTRAAAAGGYCGVIAMPNTDPAIDSPERLRAVRETAARQAHVPVGFLAAITRGLGGEELTDMEALRALGALGFTDDGHPVADAGVLRAALRLQSQGPRGGGSRSPGAGVGKAEGFSRGARRGVGGVLTLHEEDRALSRGGSMHEGAVSAELGIPGVPAASEATMVARDAVLAGCEGGRVHFQHLSCVASVRALAAAKACGVAASGEATPHHLLLSEEDVRGLDTSMKMNPPLATAADRAALVEGLRDGTIDCVATDHAPHAPAEKALPFTAAPMGTTGLETAFAALYTELVVPGVLGLGLLVERMSAGAALFELPVPQIASGASANLVLVDLDAEWIAGEHGWQSRSENCCFAGRRLRGRVLLTLAAGSIAYRAGGEAKPNPRAQRAMSAEPSSTAGADLGAVSI
ncbi:MAG TPA: dihydroorotase [Solirubrobacteraceae bacterium]|jgi:dihydroorotase|nr:dihydroorotase [Solirubrobacteraceae bacterium]